jgi:hypothetical protein
MNQSGKPENKAEENPDNLEQEIDSQTLETLAHTEKLEEGKSEEVKKTIEELHKKAHFGE